MACRMFAVSVSPNYFRTKQKIPYKTKSWLLLDDKLTDKNSLKFLDKLIDVVCLDDCDKKFFYVRASGT